MFNKFNTIHAKLYLQPHIRLLLLVSWCFSIAPFAATAMGHSAKIPVFNSVKFEKPAKQNPLIERSIAVFYRLAKERSGIDLTKVGNRRLVIQLKIDEHIPVEGYRIRHEAANKVSIAAASGKGLLYGLGKFLHESELRTNGIVPAAWQGVSVPDKKLRGMYFSTHNHNFYQDAPLENVFNYIEELSFWGLNGIEVWFDMHNYDGIDDPNAVRMLNRLSAILKKGREMGMQTCITMLGNEGYRTSPLALRADYNTHRGHYHVEICPSQPGGTKLILKQVDEELSAFLKRDTPIDQVILWPYDEGGCACKLCSPWGGNGYLKITEKLSALIRKKMPGVGITMSTWLFDYKYDQGEWTGLAAAFKAKKPWVDYILADSHGSFPSYLLSNPVPGNLPLLNFPEISMWGAWPWGVYGATPLPARFQELWNSVSDKIVGGFPYSEGIYEDINKVIFSRFYWNRKTSAQQAVREYVKFEFSHKYANDIVKVINILEKNHGMSAMKWALEPGSPKVIEYPEKAMGSETAFRLAKQVDAKLPIGVRKGWRWRILYIRAMLDYQIRRNKGVPNAEAEAGFRELLNIFYAQNGDVRVRPPVNYGERYPVTNAANGPTNDKN